MLRDIDDVPIRVSNEESADSPRLIGERVHDLDVAMFSFLVGSIDIIHWMRGRKWHTRRQVPLLIC